MESDGLAILSLTLAFLLLTGMIIFFALAFNRKTHKHRDELERIQREKERAMLQATIDAQEAERKRIGANLHDDLGPLLSTVRIYFKKLLKSNPKYDEKEAEDIQTALNEAIDQLRSVSHSMVSSVLDTFGLYAAIHEIAERLGRISPIEVLFEPDGEAPELEDKVELALYRILQESLNNIIKHAQADKICITTHTTGNEFVLSIQDNGKGFDPQMLTSGLGLQNMRARANAIGGKLEIKSQEGSGAKIIITLNKENFNI